MSDGGLTAILLLILAAVVIAVMALAGKTMKFDTGCYLSFDDGCIAGKPYRLEDDH